MKKSLALLGILSLFATACGEESKEAKLKSKTAEFEALRKEIYDLKIEIAKSDSTKTDLGKPVRISTLAISSFRHSIDIQGRVDADETVSVGPQMPGLVKNVYVHVGDNVRAGQVLATLDAEAMSQQLAGLKIQRDLAKDVAERQKNLWDQKIGTEMQYLQSRTQYDALEKQVSAMQQQVGMASLKAPMDGVVDAVNIKAGEMASPGYSNIVVVNTSKLRVKGEVAEGYVSKVKTGNPVTLYFPDADKTVESKISYSGRMINNLNRTFSVEVMLPSREEGIVPNMISVIKINDYTNDSAIVIPLSAVQQTSDGKTFVYVAVQDKAGKMVAEKRLVTYEMTYNGFAEIKTGQGLNPGDKLITDGSADLNPGDAVSAK
ncbi:MAG: efflux RND transporter periplasmic adaptor subunit [Bacteroidota bacterium]|nr:efflux RND transporter periplasmic adaptor subunit [Bacteroidota bacterium]